MATDLLCRVAQKLDGTVDATVEAAMMTVSFVGSASSGFLWVVMNVTPKHDVLVVPAVVFNSQQNRQQQELRPVDLTRWLGHQDCDTDPRAGKVMVDDGGIKYVWPDDGVPKLIVPLEQRVELAQRAHADVVGHLGVAQTLHELRQRFYWDSMRRTVEKVVASCPECQHIKGARRIAHGNYRGLHYRGPRLQYSLDTKKMADGGHILALVDTFDAYVILIPLYSKTTAEIVDALIDSVFLMHGFPRHIRTDSAKEYGTDFVARMAALGVHVTATHVAHGEGNAAVERCWQFVKATLRNTASLVDWRRRLRMAAFAYNTGVRALHGLTPFEIHYGLPALSCLQASTVSAQELELDYVPTGEELQQLRHLFAANVGICQTAGNKYRQQMAKKLNKHKAPVRFAVGDYVMAYREARGVKAKFYTRPSDFVTVWIGPFEVIETNGTIYKLVALQAGFGVDEGEILERSVKNLKKYTGPDPTMELLYFVVSSIAADSSMLVTHKGGEFRVPLQTNATVGDIYEVRVPRQPRAADNGRGVGGDGSRGR